MINDYVTFTQIAFRMAMVYWCVCVCTHASVCAFVLEFLESLFIYRGPYKRPFSFECDWRLAEPDFLSFRQSFSCVLLNFFLAFMDMAKDMAKERVSLPDIHQLLAICLKSSRERLLVSANFLLFRLLLVLGCLFSLKDPGWDVLLG